MKVPVIFAIFNRPDLTEKSFDCIRQAQPKRLFVVADGPREGHSDDTQRCAAARAVTERVEWDCEVTRDYSSINLGCGPRVSTGITNAFSRCQEAIILEDDCIPHPTFFSFCEQMLDHYRDDERVMHVTGNNFQRGNRRGEASYYFSKYPHIWGWATWKRAWQYFDFNLMSWPEFKQRGFLTSLGNDARESIFWTKFFDQTFESQPTTWDYQWVYACWRNSGLTVTPQVNLVENIGFRADGTHSSPSSSSRLMVPSGAAEELRHPSHVCRDAVADQYTFEQIYAPFASAPDSATASSFRSRLDSVLRTIGLGRAGR